MKASHLTAAGRTLWELVEIPSVNPAFLPADDQRAGEHDVAAYLAEQGEALKLELEWQPVFEGRSNVILRLLPKTPPKTRILLAPHLDTVGGEGPHLFRPKVSNGRLYGRGACDTKGSVAAMLTALGNIASSGRRPNETEIVFLGLVDEENAQMGSRTLVKEGWRANLAVVGEPTRLEVVTAHKGDVWLALETSGKAAHGARPALGRNAVHEMARIVDILETEYADRLTRQQHPLLGHPTINVGKITGGNQPNIVPDRCVIEVDRRYLPGETEAGIRQEIKQLLEHHQLRPRLRSLKPAPCWPLETNETLPLVQQFQQSVRRRRASGVDFFCDAGVLDRGGIPSLVFGPGNIAQAHTSNEWIPLRSLDRATDLLERFLTSLP